MDCAKQSWRRRKKILEAGGGRSFGSWRRKKIFEAGGERRFGKQEEEEEFWWICRRKIV